MARPPRGGRSDLLERRVVLMSDWAAHVVSALRTEAPEVVTPHSRFLGRLKPNKSANGARTTLDQS
jgi:hypothetical protein